MEKIESVAHIRFEKKGFPSSDDIIRAREKDLELKLNEVPEKITEKFMDVSDQLIQKFGAKEAIARLLFLQFGWKDLTQRSLLTGEEGFISLIMEWENPVPGLAFIR